MGGIDLVHEIPLSYFDVDNNNLCPPYPDCLINPEPFTDVNNNGIWDSGEPFEDTNESGYYDEDQIGYQNTSECIECFGGDLNYDNVIDISDIIITVNCVILDNCNYCSDLNGDGLSDIFDIILMINIILNN